MERGAGGGGITRFAAHAAIVVALTLLTQVGGVAWLAAVWAGRRVRTWPRRIPVAVVAFAISYAALHVAARPAAAAFGPVALPCAWERGDAPVPITRALCALNRHYATPAVFEVLHDLAGGMNDGALPPVYLDAGFPFLDGFPLLPHLSHDDGSKVDLAFFYKNAKGGGGFNVWRSRIGYWAFEEPRPGDPQPCAGRDDWLTMRWEMAWFPTRDFALDEERTAGMIRLLAADSRVTKILLEPYLVRRLGLAHPKVRFQGCRAARHDDHIHSEVR